MSGNTTIKLDRETKFRFDKAKIEHRSSNNKQRQTQDEFMNTLLDHWEDDN